MHIPLHHEGVLVSISPCLSQTLAHQDPVPPAKGFSRLETPPGSSSAPKLQELGARTFIFPLFKKKKEKKSLNLPFVSNRKKGEKRKKEERGALTGSSPACNTKPCCAGKPYTAPHPARALPRRSLPPGCFPKPKLPLREAKSQPLLKSLFVWIPFPNQRILRLNSLPPLCRAF